MLFEIVVILLLIVLNGLFAMSETAVVSSRQARLQQMAQTGNSRAQLALDMAQTPNRFLSTVQIGITLVGITAGALGGANIADGLSESLSTVPWLVPYASTISLTLVVGITTFLSVVIGEVVPKRIALANAERIATNVSLPMNTLSVIATPAVRLISLATDGILALLRMDGQSEDVVSEDEIRVMVQQAAAADNIEDAERDMVESIFRLNDRPLRSMMTPRPEIVWLDVNASIEEIRGQIIESHHSRFPICDGDLDNIVGAVHAKDMLSDCLEGESLDIESVIDKPLFVPESMQTLSSLEHFKRAGVHMALLVDEYGQIEGLVTLIDILEAIVGDIPTAGEIASPPIVQRDDGSWLVDGLVSVEDFKDAFAIRTLPSEDKYQTLGGFIVLMLGSLPSEGKHFGWGGFRFEVADMDGHRIDKVIIEQAPSDAH